EANLEKAKGELAKEGILVESSGGKIPSVETSASANKEKGIEEILEMILLVSEMENTRVDISKPAEGVIIESHSDGRQGIKISAIMSQGVLEAGSFIGTPSAFGKVKSLEDFQGGKIGKAFPADPISIFGFESLPKTGENFKVFSSAEEAKAQMTVLGARKTSFEAKKIAFDQKVLNLILKADCQGSIEAIEGVLKEIPHEKVVLQTLCAEEGDINESDIRSAKSNRAIIFGFRVKLNPTAKIISERDRIRIMNFEIIYDLVEGVRKLMEAKVSPDVSVVELGRVRILAVFLTEKNRQVIGGRVLIGQIEKGSRVEVQRLEEIIGRGKIINLQRNKKESSIVKKGEECGMLYEGDVKVEKEDILIAQKEERTKGEL
ncbi:MAG: hypothetical protein Q7K28_03165, partial [Candidatus Wildermuthbacteria bacterium]|nr:hypothetical protein [Candidatus Wildermuthbacteria bacterium]